jgi:hypothetical protein
MAFNAPIPGQSLTTTPKNYPWERPPEINDPEEAIQMHLTRLSDPEVLEAALDLIELEDLDIQTVVKGLMRSAISKGLHSIDVALLVSPVVHEFIKQAAKAAKIDAEDGFVDKAAKGKQEQATIAARARKQLVKLGAKPKEVVKEIVEEVEVPEKEAPRNGLMARGGA